MRRILLLLILCAAGCEQTRQAETHVDTATQGNATGTVIEHEHRVGTANGQPVDLTIDKSTRHEDNSEQKQVATSKTDEKITSSLSPEEKASLALIPEMAAKLLTGNYVGAASQGFGAVMNWFTGTPQGATTGLGTAASMVMAGLHLHKRGKKKGHAEAKTQKETQSN